MTAAQTQSKLNINFARLARPYAQAAFEYAKEHQQLPQWSEMLRTNAAHVQNPSLAAMLHNPHYSAEICGEAILALSQSALDQAGENFIKILAQAKRLFVLPDIYQLFEQLRTGIEKTLQVQVKSAVALTETQAIKLKTSLTKKFKQPVALTYNIDPSILGGFIASAGDRVVDSSIRGQLEKLKETLNV
jgi:F-type H+-transporting ATPase subunit delta